MQRILLIDSYDSFTFNLVHYLEAEDVQVDVVYSDEIQFDKVMDYDKIVLSPGPGLPSDYSGIEQLINQVKGKLPILGVCLGMQAIAEQLQGELYNQREVKHGVSETIFVKDSLLFHGLDTRQEVGLYHSWAIRSEGDFDIVAISEKEVVMAIENEEEKLYGVQFHPESVMTLNGRQILKNFIQKA